MLLYTMNEMTHDMDSVSLNKPFPKVVENTCSYIEKFVYSDVVTLVYVENRYKETSMICSSFSVSIVFRG